MDTFSSRIKVLLNILLFHFGMMIKAQVPDFSSYPVYKGNDLGLRYSKAKSSFRVYAPSAKQVQLALYHDALEGEPGEGSIWNRPKTVPGPLN